MIEPHTASVPSYLLPPLPRQPLRLVLDEVRSAHNVGATFRTADATACEQLDLLSPTPHPPHPQILKTALGATEYVPWKSWNDREALVRDLQQGGYTLVALESGEGAVSLFDLQWPSRPALIIGSEVSGVSDPFMEAVQTRVSIPMLGYKGSLNVATAVGIAVYGFLQYRLKGASSSD